MQRTLISSLLCPVDHLRVTPRGREWIAQLQEAEADQISVRANHNAWLSHNGSVSVCLQLVPSQRDVEGVEMDTQSCVDHSILAIFEDSTVTSEVRLKADQHKEHLWE